MQPPSEAKAVAGTPATKRILEAVTVEQAELEAARSDPEVVRLLQDAAIEGARVKREGRQRW